LSSLAIVKAQATFCLSPHLLPHSRWRWRWGWRYKFLFAAFAYT